MKKIFLGLGTMVGSLVLAQKAKEVVIIKEESHNLIKFDLKSGIT